MIHRSAHLNQFIVKIGSQEHNFYTLFFLTQELKILLKFEDLLKISHF